MSRDKCFVSIKRDCATWKSVCVSLPSLVYPLIVNFLQGGGEEKKKKREKNLSGMCDSVRVYPLVG